MSSGVRQTAPPCAGGELRQRQRRRAACRQRTGRWAKRAMSSSTRASSVNPRRQEGPHAHCVTFDPAGRFLFVCDLGLDKVMIYRFDAEQGKLTPHEPAFASVKPGAGPRHMAFRPDGRFAYVINELDSTITAFAYDAEAGTADGSANRLHIAAALRRLQHDGRNRSASQRQIRVRLEPRPRERRACLKSTRMRARSPTSKSKAPAARRRVILSSTAKASISSLRTRTPTRCWCAASTSGNGRLEAVGRVRRCALRRCASKFLEPADRDSRKGARVIA